jgi:hypothetical protein
MVGSGDGLGVGEAGLERPHATDTSAGILRRSAPPAGAESGAVAVAAAPPVTFDKVLALARRLDLADRRRVVEPLLSEAEVGVR